jgi:RND family efflux transporter MFP subunit
VVLGEPQRSDVRRFPGRVQAYQTAQLAFQVSGPLVELPVTEGQEVAKGDLLASIDPRDYQNELKARQSDAAETLKQFERYAELLKTKSVPEDQYQLQKANYEMAAARLKQAEKNLDDTNLRAPFGGIVARRYVENFQNIKAKDPIVLLEDVSRLDVLVQVAEQGLATLDPEQLRAGIQVGDVIFENLPDRRFPVAVKEFQIEANPETQTYQVTLTLPAPDEVHILPGMTATVVPSGEYAKGARRMFIVPVTAVLAGPGGAPFVWLLDRGAMTVKQRAVVVGELTGGGIQVFEGLDSGDEVVSAGGPYLAEGSKVVLAPERAEG